LLVVDVPDVVVVLLSRSVSSVICPAITIRVCVCSVICGHYRCG
jgi:hypothetical protein